MYYANGYVITAYLNKKVRVRCFTGHTGFPRLTSMKFLEKDGLSIKYSSEMPGYPMRSL